MVTAAIGASAGNEKDFAKAQAGSRASVKARTSRFIKVSSLGVVVGGRALPALRGGSFAGHLPLIRVAGQEATLQGG